MLSESSVGSECPVVPIIFDLPRELYKLQVRLASQFLFVLYLVFFFIIIDINTVCILHNNARTDIYEGRRRASQKIPSYPNPMYFDTGTQPAQAGCKKEQFKWKVIIC